MGSGLCKGEIDYYLYSKSVSFMHVTVHQCLAGARAAQGIAVLIDVFRASNTIIACLDRGAVRVKPVAELTEAYRLKDGHPEYLLFGERGGLAQEGFDSGNSPWEVSGMDLKGQTVILTTSAGSQGFSAMSGCSSILVASFANLGAVARYVIQRQPGQVSLVAMGLDAREPAEEDDTCARCLKQALQGTSFGFDAVRRELLQCAGANRLRGLGQQEDLEWCLRLNSSVQVPRFDPEDGWITASNKG